ncbi:MAG: hypothetical protein JWL77_5130 [Chthonomonadaceae bacterium]|nr:hypothetical protein [Chthonomonadaceae bacterium]
MAETENGHLTLKTTAEPAIELPPDPASFELRILQAKQMRVFRQAGVARLTLENDRSWTKVAVARAFPLSDPDHYLGFLDGAGKDIGMLHDPALLDPASRQVVDEELAKRYFVPVIERVFSVKEEFGTVYWKVETDRGEKEIIVRNLRDNIQELSATRVIITDIDGNRFEFADLTKMDTKTQGFILRNL